MNFDLELDKDEKWYWPMDPIFNKKYKIWILFHCFYVLIVTVGRVAFENKPI